MPASFHFPKPEIQFFPSENNPANAVFSIVIPTWNNLEMLKCCIDSIRNNSAFPHQIILHVNDGSDGTLDWVKEQKLDYTYSAENAGVCYPMNAMATLAKTSFLLYLNDDMYVCRNWDKALLEAANSYTHDNWFLSGTMIEPAPSRFSPVLAPHHFGRDVSTFRKEDLDTFASEVKGQDWFGSSWPPSLIRLSLFLKVGGYSEEFSPGFYSDPDFSMKLWKAGVREFRGVGNSLVYHFMSKSTVRVQKNNGRKQFAQKWGISSSVFYHHFLQMGKRYDPKIQLKEPGILRMLLARIKAIWIIWK